jgi:hypothetical protein
VIHDKALQTRAVVGQLADAVQDQVNDLLADGVVATGVVVGGVFLTRNQLLWVVDGMVGSSAYFVDHCGFEVYEDGTWYVLAGTGLGEECVE